MPGTECLDVWTGAGRWMRRLHIVLFTAALLATVLSHTDLWLKSILLSILFPVAVVVAHRLNTEHSRGRLRLLPDGLGWIRDDQTDEQVMRLNHAWVSRWVCMVPCRQLSSGKRRDFMVCASDNDPDDYRRLLTVLRSGSGPAKKQGFRLA